MIMFNYGFDIPYVLSKGSLEEFRCKIIEMCYEELHDNPLDVHVESVKPNVLFDKPYLVVYFGLLCTHKQNWLIEDLQRIKEKLDYKMSLLDNTVIR